MKPILPKTLVTGGNLPQIHSILASPGTTIILAPTMAPTFTLGAHRGPQSSSIILPSQSTSSITLAAQSVPQPTPVMLPLTDTQLGVPKNINVRCPPLLAPKNYVQKQECQENNTKSVKGKSRCRKRLVKQQDTSTVTRARKSNCLEKSKQSLLPKPLPAEAHTIIFLPAPEQRMVATSPVIVSHNSVLVKDHRPSDGQSDKTVGRSNNQKTIVKKYCQKIPDNVIQETDISFKLQTVTSSDHTKDTKDMSIKKILPKFKISVVAKNPNKEKLKVNTNESKIFVHCENSPVTRVESVSTPFENQPSVPTEIVPELGNSHVSPKTGVSCHLSPPDALCENAKKTDVVSQQIEPSDNLEADDMPREGQCLKKASEKSLVPSKKSSERRHSELPRTALYSSHMSTNSSGSESYPTSKTPGSVDISSEQQISSHHSLQQSCSSPSLIPCHSRSSQFFSSLTSRKDIDSHVMTSTSCSSSASPVYSPSSRRTLKMSSNFFKTPSTACDVSSYPVPSSCQVLNTSLLEGVNYSTPGSDKPLKASSLNSSSQHSPSDGKSSPVPSFSSTACIHSSSSASYSHHPSSYSDMSPVIPAPQSSSSSLVLLHSQPSTVVSDSHSSCKPVSTPCTSTVQTILSTSCSQSASISHQTEAVSCVPPSQETFHEKSSQKFINRPSSCSVPHTNFAYSTGFSHSATYTTLPESDLCTQVPHPTPYTHISHIHAQSPHPTSQTQSPQPTSYTNSPQTGAYTQSPQPTSYTQSPQPISYIQSPQPTSYSQSPHPPAYLESPQSVSYIESPQPTSYTQSSHAASYIWSSQSDSHTHSHYRTLYIQSSQPESYLHSPQSVSYTHPHHLLSCAQSPQPNSYSQSLQSSSYSHTLYEGSQGQSEHVTSCSQSPQPHGYSSTHRCMIKKEPHSPHTSSPVNKHISCCQSPHPEAHFKTPQTTPVPSEVSPNNSVVKENSRSLHLLSQSGQRNFPTSQYFPSPNSTSYTNVYSSQPNAYCYSTNKNMPLPSSSSALSGETSCSFLLLERSLSPPSYETHLKNTASHTTSSHHSLDSQYDMVVSHQQTTPTNYSLSCPNTRVTPEISSLHTDLRKSVRSPPAYPYSPAQALPPPPPRYTSNPHITLPPHHADHAPVQATEINEYHEYNAGDTSQNSFLPSAFPMLSASAAAAPFENYPDFQDYSTSRSLGHNVGSTHSLDKSLALSNTIHLPNPDDTHIPDKQRRLQDSHNRTYRYSEQQTVYKNSSQESDMAMHDWRNSAQEDGTHCSENLKVHSIIERAERLWFIPHQEQNRVYIKRRELAREFLSHPDLHSSRDTMLKEKFWIDEDEPVAEEILLSSLTSNSEEYEEQEDTGDAEEMAAGCQDSHPQEALTNISSNKKQVRGMLCQVCGKMLKSRDSLRSHLNSHQGIQPHACPYCSKCFTNRSVLVQHLRIHSGEKPYVCSICSRPFRTRSSLVRHKTMHTNLRPYECSMCSKAFKTKLVLEQHLKLHLTDLFPCSICKKTFKSQRALAVHRTSHSHKSQRFSCPHCHKGYRFRSLLSHHMQVHSNVRKHECSVCSESFVWRSGLAAHMKTHSESRPKCDICGISFASEKRLKTHQRRHSNPQRHHCEICGRNFSHAYRLASHSLIHQGHKEYACSSCGIMFTSAKKLRKHLASHRKEEKRICQLSGRNEMPKSKSL